MFELSDWEKFRSLEGLCQKAGVSQNKLGALIPKELVDNALDTGSEVEIGFFNDIHEFYVADNGPGIDPRKLPRLFSFKRPLMSSKFIRLPSRGRLGNGLRVVAAAVLATNGELKITTRGKSYRLIPQFNGETICHYIEDKPGKSGTLVAIRLGRAGGIIDPTWANRAVNLAGIGKEYRGKTSPYWYTASDFHELCLAAKGMTVRDLVNQFEGCSGSKSGEIASGFKSKLAPDITPDETSLLLDRMRAISKAVSSDRLGYVGREAFSSRAYYKDTGTYEIKINGSNAKIPLVIEAWAKTTEGRRSELNVNINRTPITGEVGISHEDTTIYFSGYGLNDLNGHYVARKIGKRRAIIDINIITPYIPLTSEGKAPDLSKIVDYLIRAVQTSIKRARRQNPLDKKVSIKAFITDRNVLESAIDMVSGGRKYRYSERQLFYNIRTQGFETKSYSIMTDFRKSSPTTNAR